MVQKTAYQSFSMNLQYASYEQKSFSLKTADDEPLFDVTLTRERRFQMTLDIQAASAKEIKAQAKPFLKFIDKNNPLSGTEPRGSEWNGEEMTLDLFEKEGYWGVEKTSQRIIDFVVNAAGTDLEKLKAGREGVLRGLKEAEKAWGGELPQISYDTAEMALSTIDKKIEKMDGKIIDIVT